MNNISETFSSNLELLQNPERGLQMISGVDFAMQVQSNWRAYLTYTGIRCAALAYKYFSSVSENQPRVWEEAQLYAGMKVAGLLTSQTMLSLLGKTTIKSVAAILSWGGVLASCSMYAHHRSKA